MVYKQIKQLTMKAIQYISVIPMNYILYKVLLGKVIFTNRRTITTHL